MIGDPLTLEQLREVPHGKIKDETLKSICNRANEIACPSAHIDREAWGCPICSGNEVIEFKAWKTPEQIINGPFAQGGAMFCTRCGKPRTPEAWAELKKRLRGCGV